MREWTSAWRYRANRLTVVRELRYATKQVDWDNRLDLTLFLNGIPIATAELKNPLTRQGVEHAKEQYRSDRDPTELIFTRRVIANFAVDPDLVFVATQLRGKNTRFLPFNTGSNGAGQPGGAGNPARTAYGTYAPVGAGLGTGQLARPAPALRAPEEDQNTRRRHNEDDDLPALPPVGRGQEADGSRRHPRRGAELPRRDSSPSWARGLLAMPGWRCDGPARPVER